MGSDMVVYRLLWAGMAPGWHGAEQAGLPVWGMAMCASTLSLTLTLCLGPGRRGAWPRAGRSPARLRTSACWRSLARGCALPAPGCTALPRLACCLVVRVGLRCLAQPWHAAGLRRDADTAF